MSGLTLGSVYALIALGYSMVYGILKLLNFAHGDVYMVGAFIGFFVLQCARRAGSTAVPIALARVSLMHPRGAMLGCGLLGVAIERFAYRPLRNAPRIAPLISALGVSIFLQNAALLLFGAPTSADYGTLRPDRGQDATALGQRLHLEYLSSSTIVPPSLLMVALTLFVRARGSARRCGRRRSTARPPR